MSDITVTHVSIGQGGIEIGYSERRDRAEKAVLFRTLMVDRDIVGPELAELLEVIQTIVDIGIEEINKQPDTIPFMGR